MRFSDKKYGMGDDILDHKPDPKPRKNFKLLNMLRNRRRGFGKPRESVIFRKAKILEESLEFAYPSKVEPSGSFRHEIIDLKKVQEALDQEELLFKLKKSIKKDPKF